MSFIDEWLEEKQPNTAHRTLLIYEEKRGTRTRALKPICEAVKDHLIGLDVLSNLGFPKAAVYLKNRLPTVKKVRSGDLGEIFATEFIAQKTKFRILLKRLRHKDDRNTSMRGDDVIGILTTAQRTLVLKAEAKSQAALTNSTVTKAIEALKKNDGRPNPATLGYPKHF